MKIVTFIFFLFLMITYNKDMCCMNTTNPFVDIEGIRKTTDSWLGSPSCIQTIHETNFTQAPLKMVSGIAIHYHLDESALLLILQCDWLFVNAQRFTIENNGIKDCNDNAQVYLEQTKNKQYYDLIIKHSTYEVDKTLARISTQDYHDKVDALSSKQSSFSVNFVTQNSSDYLLLCLSARSTDKNDLKNGKIIFSRNANYHPSRDKHIYCTPTQLNITQKEIDNSQDYNLLDSTSTNSPIVSQKVNTALTHMKLIQDNNDLPKKTDRRHSFLTILLLVSLFSASATCLSLYYMLL